MPKRRPARHRATPDGALLPPGVAAAVRARDGDLLIEALAPLVTAHAGSIRGAHKFALYKVAEADLTDPSAARRWADELSKRPEAVAKQFAMQILGLHAQGAAGAASAVDASVRILERGADSPNWEVRETAGAVLARLLSAEPDAFGPTVRAWSRAPSANLRRAVVVALKGAVREEPGRADEFLDVLEGLASDGDEYVRKNLGSFAVGDGFLRAAPGPTMKRLERWVKSPDEWVRWNAVCAFTAAAARRHLKAALPLLRTAAGDRRAVTARAVVRALLNLAAEDRAAVVRAVSAWGEDEPRRAAAAAFSQRLHGRSS